MHGDLLVRGGVYYLLLVMGRRLEEMPWLRLQAPISGREAGMKDFESALNALIFSLSKAMAITVVIALPFIAAFVFFSLIFSVVQAEQKREEIRSAPIVRLYCEVIQQGAQYTVQIETCTILE